MTTPTLPQTDGLLALRRGQRATLERHLVPPPRLTVSEWADRFRQLSREASAEPGQWQTDRAPYQRGVMDAFSDPRYEQVVVMFSSQSGKTEIVLNVMGFFAHQDPSPILAVQPTIEEAEGWSKQRVASMIRDTPALSGLFADPRTRNSGNTLRLKEFPGGHLTVVGANSPAGLAAKPIRVVLGDEVDRWPASAGAEGDPMTLATRRTSTFWNRKLGWFSTPTIKGMSRIEAAYESGTQCRYYVPCPDCDHRQLLVWGNLRWEDGDPTTAAYACEGCGALIPERAKTALLAGGDWVATHPERRVASFHLNALYSPWARWADLVAEWLEAQHSPARLQAFINTVLGETWDEAGTILTGDALERRREVWQGIPAGVAVLTLGVDVQADRLEYQLVGWGAGEEVWALEFGVIAGDPAQAGVWDKLEVLRTQTRTLANGRTTRVYATGVDSGYQTDAVYDYCRPRWSDRVYAVKGSSSAGKPIAPRRPSVLDRSKVRLYEIGTDAAKDTLYSRLKMQLPGPQYVHIAATLPPEWFVQITAEKLIKRKVAGRWVRRYELPRGERAEALDTMVYALAALRIALPRVAMLDAAARTMAEPPVGPPVPESSEPQVTAPVQVVPPVVRQGPTVVGRMPGTGKGGWMGGWKR